MTVIMGTVSLVAWAYGTHWLMLAMLGGLMKAMHEPVYQRRLDVLAGLITAGLARARPASVLSRA